MIDDAQHQLTLGDGTEESCERMQPVDGSAYFHEPVGMAEAVVRLAMTESAYPADAGH